MSPQKLRTGGDNPALFEVGDRLPVNATYGYSYSETADVWVCTTAGTGGPSPTYTYYSTYTVPGTGGAVWTRYPSDSWDMALPYLNNWDNWNYGYYTAGAEANRALYVYVDADYEVTLSGGYAICVCVDRTTLLPRVGKAILRNYIGPNYYGDVASDNGRRSGTRLANKTKTVALSSSANVYRELNVTVPSTRVSSTYGAYYNGGVASRIRVRGLNPSNPDPIKGFGHVVEYPEATTSYSTYLVSDGSIAFTKVPSLTPTPDPNRVITASTAALMVRDFYRAAPTYGGHTGKPDPPRYSLGLNCKLEWVAHTYRNGAAPTGNENGSLRWIGTGNADAGPWTSGYIYLFNSLTGARTLKVFFYTDSPYVGDITNKDVWVEVFHTNSSTGGYVLTDSSANSNWGIPNVVGTVWPAGSETWTTNQTGEFQKFEIATSLTIGRAGLIAIRLRNVSNRLGLSKVFVDPYITVT